MKSLKVKLSVNKLLLMMISFIYMAIYADLNAQNVAITDDDGYTVNAAAMLDVKSINKGFLVPRVALVSTTDPVSVTKPDGLLVWNTSTSGSYPDPGFYYWSGTNWVKVGSSALDFGNGLIKEGNTVSHEDISSQSSINNSNGTVIQDVTLGSLGHVTGLGSYNLDNRYYTETEVDNLISGEILWDENSGRIYPVTLSNDVGIGTNAPLHKLHVVENVGVIDGTDGNFLDIQNSNTSYDVMSGIRFQNGTTANTFKGGIFYRDTLSMGRGDIIFANNPVSSSGNVTFGDARMVIRNEGKVEILGNPSADPDDPLLEVRNKDGELVFGVYNEGVRIYVSDPPGKGLKGGFAVGGFNSSKGITNEYLRITPDTFRIYVDDTGAKGLKGGFAVGGFGPAKGGLSNEYLRITPDSVRIYISEETGKGLKGGFAVGGFNSSKGLTDDYFNISGESAAGIMDPSQSRVLWYPRKEAFLSGKVLIESPDSIGMNSMATGYESKSIGDWSQALGFHARAFGDKSMAIGNYANAIGNNSFAFGDSAMAVGVGSYAFGSVGRDEVTGDPTGEPTTALGDYSFAIGLGAKADTIGAVAIGNEANAHGEFSTSLGYQSAALAKFSTALGYKSEASGDYSIALGHESYAVGSSSIAAGEACYASGYGSAAFGSNTFATGTYSLAMGTLTDVSGTGSAGIGHEVYVDGNYSFGFGFNCLANGYGSMSGGYQTHATGVHSFGFGYINRATGNYSVAFGNEVTASNDYSMAFGQEIESSGQHSVAWALNDQNGTDITDNNVFVIMGGKVGIGTTSPQKLLDVAGALNLNNGISSGYALYINGTDAIYYNTSEYFRWGSNGITNYFPDEVGIGASSPDRKFHVSATNAPCAKFNRTNDGSVVEFSSAGFVEGTISISGHTTSYNAFTGSHYTSINEEIQKGLLMSLTGGNTYLNDNEESEIIYGVAVSSEPNTPDIIGAYLGKEDFNVESSPHLVMSVGNGVMWVVDNGEDLAAGDYLISSSVAGHAMKDNGQFEVANIIARVAEPVNWENETEIINGLKHKLISVFFESFVMQHNEKRIEELESRISKLEQLIKASE